MTLRRWLWIPWVTVGLFVVLSSSSVLAASTPEQTARVNHSRGTAKKPKVVVNHTKKAAKKKRPAVPSHRKVEAKQAKAATRSKHPASHRTQSVSAHKLPSTPTRKVTPASDSSGIGLAKVSEHEKLDAPTDMPRAPDVKPPIAPTEPVVPTVPAPATEKAE